MDQKYDSLFAAPPSAGDNDALLMELLNQHEGGLTEEQLLEMFFPYQQEQGVLDQKQAAAQQLGQPGPERSTPMGALLGGLSNAVGGIGGAVLQNKTLGEQRALGGRMQKDAAGRLTMLEELLRKKRTAPGVDDELDYAAPLE